MKWALVLLLALPAIAAPQEKWYEAYNRGVAATRGGSYAAGAEALQRAIAEMPQENGAALGRNVIFTYVPHFWLGIAKFNLGDPDAALREWKTSEEQGVVQNTPYYAQLKDWVSRAQSAKQRSSESAAAESRKAADVALSKALSGQAEAALTPGADRTETYRAAQRKLKEGLDLFNKAGTNIAQYHHVADIASQARELFAAATEEAKKQKARPPVVITNETVKPKPVEPPAPKPEPPPPVPPPPTITAAPVEPVVETESEAHVAARIALRQYRRHLIETKTRPPRDLANIERELSAAKDDAALQRITERLTSLDRELVAKPVPVPSLPIPAAAAPAPPPDTRLADAYRAFATGDFDAADRALSELVAARGSAEAYLLRGCARWTKAMLTRNPDFTTAKSDFDAALHIDRSLRLDPNAFSPKLVAYFAQLKAGR